MEAGRFLRLRLLNEIMNRAGLTGQRLLITVVVA